MNVMYPDAGHSLYFSRAVESDSDKSTALVSKIPINHGLRAVILSNSLFIVFGVLQQSMVIEMQIKKPEPTWTDPYILLDTLRSLHDYFVTAFFILIVHDNDHYMAYPVL